MNNLLGLHRLLKRGSKAEIFKIPRYKVDLQQIYENGDTVYHVVLRNKELKEEEITAIFQMFLDQGVNPATLNDHSKAPLHLAIQYRMIYVVIFLIQYTPRLHDSPYVMTRFFIIDENAKFRHGAKRNCDQLKFWNSEKVESASASFFGWLILKELNPDPESNRESCLELLNSCIENNLQHVTLAFLKLTPIKLINTALPEFLALFQRFFETIVRARMHHNNWLSKDWYSSYSSRYASKIVKIFLENGAIVDDSWRKDLYWAVKQKEDIGVIKLLVDHFSDNSVKRDFARNFFKAMLEYPCMDLSNWEVRCYKQVLRDLVSKGAEVKNDYALCLEGETPLQLAVKAQNIPAAAFLKGMGATLNVVTRQGRNLLHLLAKSRSENQKMCEWLVHKGLDVNARDYFRRTPLHSAAEKENVALARKLIELGADVNCRDDKKQTPLHYAVINNGLIQLAKLLLQNGADIDVENISDESPLILAIFPLNLKFKFQMVRLLLNWGARIDTIYAAKDRKRPRFWRNYSDRYIRNDVKVLLNQHCLKLVAAGLLVTNNSTSSLRVTIDQQFYQECFKEVGTLKHTFINGCTSLYYFLHMNLDRKSLYAKNEELRKLVDPDKLEKNFPQYSSVILVSYRAGKTRNSLLERAKVAWMELTEIYLPDICIERVLFYLRNEELVKVIVEP